MRVVFVFLATTVILAYKERNMARGRDATKYEVVQSTKQAGPSANQSRRLQLALLGCGSRGQEDRVHSLIAFA